jgi:hypothetical protein
MPPVQLVYPEMAMAAFVLLDFNASYVLKYHLDLFVTQIGESGSTVVICYTRWCRNFCSNYGRLLQIMGDQYTI